MCMFYIKYIKFSILYYSASTTERETELIICLSREICWKVLVIMRHILKTLNILINYLTSNVRRFMHLNNECFFSPNSVTFLSHFKPKTFIRDDKISKTTLHVLKKWLTFSFVLFIIQFLINFYVKITKSRSYILTDPR